MLDSQAKYGAMRHFLRLPPRDRRYLYDRKNRGVPIVSIDNLGSLQEPDSRVSEAGDIATQIAYEAWLTRELLVHPENFPKVRTWDSVSAMLARGVRDASLHAMLFLDESQDANTNRPRNQKSPQYNDWFRTQLNSENVLEAGAIANQLLFQYRTGFSNDELLKTLGYFLNSKMNMTSYSPAVDCLLKNLGWDESEFIERMPGSAGILAFSAFISLNPAFHQILGLQSWLDLQPGFRFERSIEFIGRTGANVSFGEAGLTDSKWIIGTIADITTSEGISSEQISPSMPFSKRKDLSADQIWCTSYNKHIDFNEIKRLDEAELTGLHFAVVAYHWFSDINNFQLSERVFPGWYAAENWDLRPGEMTHPYGVRQLSQKSNSVNSPVLRKNLSTGEVMAPIGTKLAFADWLRLERLESETNFQFLFMSERAKSSDWDLGNPGLRATLESDLAARFCAETYPVKRYSRGWDIPRRMIISTEH